MSVYILIYMDKIFASGLVVIVTTLAIYLSSLTPPELNVAGFSAKSIGDGLKVATIADCSYIKGKIICQDNVYYRCGNKTKKLEGNVVNCNNLTLVIDPLKLQKAEFDNGWKDPRG